MPSHRVTLLTLAILGGAISAHPAGAAAPAATEATVEADAATPRTVDRAAYEAIVGKAIVFAQQAQAEDGTYSSRYGSGVTSLMTTALLRHGRTPQDPVIAKALAALEKNVQPDGGVYQTGTNYRNYETCLAIMCFSEARKALPEGDDRYDKLLAGAEAFVKNLQWDADEGHGPESMNYGGAGYGRHGRPDLSNTGFFIEALKSLGRGEDDPNLQAALAFVSRAQNLETEANTTPFAALVEDGGFYYTPAAGGQSQAGQTANGGLRSYGSMTYVGLKSMLYAGVGPDDPRVKAAYDWARQNYTIEQNPGMGSSGYFYYLHTFAKALDAIGEDTVVDAGGVSHAWRAELVERLTALQADDGSWVNEDKRWLESDPNLVVGYCLLALSYCQP
ncbi:MAG: prenyltransferase/squalene oxidase repeat-containing protein [Planctomycetota bacterium]